MEACEINEILQHQEGLDELELGQVIKCPFCGCTETGVVKVQQGPTFITMSCDNGHLWKIRLTEWEGWSFLKVELVSSKVKYEEQKKSNIFNFDVKTE